MCERSSIARIAAHGHQMHVQFAAGGMAVDSAAMEVGILECARVKQNEREMRNKNTSSRKGTPDIADTRRRVWSEFKRSIALLKQAGREALSLLANLISIGLLYKNHPDFEVKGDGNCLASSSANVGEKKSGIATCGNGAAEWNAAANCGKH
jgi:hypothetical protein